MRRRSQGCERREWWSWPFGLLEGDRDVVLVGDVLRQLLRPLGGCGSGQPSLILTRGQCVAPDPRRARCQDQSEEVVRITRENGIGLRARDRGVPGNGANAAQVVPLVGIEVANHLIGSNS